MFRVGTNAGKINPKLDIRNPTSKKTPTFTTFSGFMGVLLWECDSYRKSCGLVPAFAFGVKGNKVLVLVGFVEQGVAIKLFFHFRACQYQLGFYQTKQFG